METSAPDPILCQFRAEPGIIEVVSGVVFSKKPHPQAAPRMYLIQRKNSIVPEWSLTWCFPGGKVEPGETHQQALVREFREETGATVKVGPMLTSVIRVAYPGGLVNQNTGIKYRVTTYYAEIIQGVPHVAQEAGVDDGWFTHYMLYHTVSGLIPGTLDAADSAFIIHGNVNKSPGSDLDRVPDENRR